MAPAEVPEMPSIRSQGSSSKPVEHAPGERAVRTAALQRKIHKDGGTRRIHSRDTIMSR